MNKMKIILSILFIGSVAFGAALSKPPVEQQPSSLILLTESNHALLRGPVTDASVSQVIVDLSAVIQKRKALNYPLYLVLDTPGGSVDAGLRLYEFLHTYDNIHTITLGSYSMGAFLVEMLPGNRYITATGTIMFHRMSVAFSSRHNIDQIIAQTKYLLAQETMVIGMVAKRTGVAAAVLEKMFTDELFLSADEAIQQKFVDKVISVRCSTSLINKQVTEIISGGGLFPDLQIEKSACPLIP